LSQTLRDFDRCARVTFHDGELGAQGCQRIVDNLDAKRGTLCFECCDRRLESAPRANRSRRGSTLNSWALLPRASYAPDARRQVTRRLVLEQHVHAANGATLLAGGRPKFVGPGTKKRNFVAAPDVAELVTRALLDEPLPFRALEIGVEPRASHLPNATPDKTCRSACTPARRQSARHRWTRAILRRHHAPRMIHQDLDGARSG
jgi:hypothetical protein